MRVIAGLAKGHHLKAPKGLTTRPTSDKVRGAIFAMLESLLAARRAAMGEEQDPWAGLRVLDLYAGTGALGIEALSRGAAAADFVEVDPSACRVIRENLAHTKLASQGRVYCTAVQQFIRQRLAGGAKAAGEGYDLVLMDPPYAEPGLEELLGTIGSSAVLRAGGWLVVEHSRRRSLPDEVARLVRLRERRHGDTEVSIYALRPEEMAEVVSGQAPGQE